MADVQSFLRILRLLAERLGFQAALCLAFPVLCIVASAHRARGTETDVSKV